MSLTSDEVNILVYRYLEESGFSHTAFAFVAESQITKSPTSKVNLPPGALLAFLQKGLQYTEIEAHLNEDGTAVPFESEFSLLTPYLPKGGLTPKPSSATKRKLASGRSKKGGRREFDGVAPFDPSVSETAVLPLTGHHGLVYHCAWNPVHHMIASGSEDATVRIWNLVSVAPPNRCSRHLGGQVSAAAISLDHRPSIESGESAMKHAGTATVTVVDWSPDGRRLATGCQDGPVRIWNLQDDGVSMKFGMALPRKAGKILALRWSPDGVLIAGGSDADGGVTVWKAKDGSVVLEYAAHKRMVSDLSWRSLAPTQGLASSGSTESGPKYFLATCSPEKIIHVFSTQSSQPLWTLTGHSGEINSVQWSPEGSYLLSASDDRTARVWSVQNLEESAQGEANASSPVTLSTSKILEGHRKEVYTACWSQCPQPRSLSTDSKGSSNSGGGGDRGTNALVASSSDSSSSSSSASSSRSKSMFLVATGSFDHTIKLWDPISGDCLRTLTRHSSHVYSVAFSPNGRYLASGSYDSEVLVWDVNTGTVLLSYMHSRAAAGAPGIFDVQWSSGGDKVAASFADKTICVLDFDGHSAATEKKPSTEPAKAAGKDNGLSATNTDAGTIAGAATSSSSGATSSSSSLHDQAVKRARN